MWRVPNSAHPGVLWRKHDVGSAKHGIRARGEYFDARRVAVVVFPLVVRRIELERQVEEKLCALGLPDPRLLRFFNIFAPWKLFQV